MGVCRCAPFDCKLVFSQSQLSACSKALESSEELLEMANQTLCSSETDGFTQVTDSHAAAPFDVNFSVHIRFNLSSLCCHTSSDFNMATGSFFVLNDNMMGSYSVLSSLRVSPLFFLSLSVLLLSRRPKTLRIGIVLSNPLLSFCHSLL